MNDDIKDYYINLKEEVKFDFSTAVPNRDFYFTNTEQLEGKNVKNGVVYYLGSNLTEVQPSKLRILKQADKPWDNFNEADGVYQMFVHYDNLKMIIDYITKKNEFEYNINNNDLPKTVSFRVDVNSLSKFYPEILSQRPPDENLEVRVLAHSLRIEPISGKIFKASFETVNKIYSLKDGALIFEMTADFNYQMKLEFNGDFTVNVIIIPSGFSLSEVIVPSKYSGVTISVLNRMIFEGYQKDLREKPYYLFKKPLPFNKKFARINDVKFIDGQGIVIIGDPINLEAETKTK